jgi:hypothetical protein
LRLIQSEWLLEYHAHLKPNHVVKISLLDMLQKKKTKVALNKYVVNLVDSLFFVQYSLCLGFQQGIYVMYVSG